MNEKDFTLLDDYFNGQLSPPEAQQLRERLAVDPEFAREFALREDMESYPRRAELRQAMVATLKHVELDFFRYGGSSSTDDQPLMEARVNWKRWLAVAASIAVLVAAYVFFNQPSPLEYRQLAQHAPLSLTVRGSSDQAVSNAEKAFASKNYAVALQNIEQVLAQAPDNITALHYKAICLLETGRSAEARQIWEQMAGGNSALKNEARWYLALSYLKENDLPAFKTALQNIEAGSDRYEKAQELLGEMK